MNEEQERKKKLGRKLAHARRVLEEHIAQVRRSANLVGEWQRRVRYYEVEIEKTAEQRAAAKAKGEERKALRKAAKRTRIIGEEE